MKYVFLALPLLAALVLGPVPTAEAAPAAGPPSAKTSAQPRHDPGSSHETLRSALKKTKADADAQALLRRVREAYQSTKTYRSVVTFSQVVKQGRWTQTQTGDFRVALDRTGDHPRLLLDRPSLKLVVSDGHLRLKVPDIPGRYLDTELDQPLSYATLTGLLPQLSSPALPDLAFLLARDPARVLSGFAPSRVTVKGGKLVMSNEQGTLTLTPDPRTSLVRRAVMTPREAQSGGPGNTSTRQIYKVDVKARNQPLPDGAFAFDASGQAMHSIYTFMGRPKPRPSDTSSSHPLIGQPVPAVKLSTLGGKAVDLAHPGADVTVVDFFATWCVWCRVWLPNLDKIRQWARDRGKSVRIYVVSVDQHPKAMREYWAGTKTGLTLLMPDDPKAVQEAFGSVQPGAHGIQQKSLPLPTTVVIQGRTIKDVHQGVAPNMRQRLQRQIQQLLQPAGD